MTSSIHPARSIDELKREALRLHPPHESGTFQRPDLVDLATLGPGLRFDLRYARADNVLGAPLYEKPRALLQRPAAEALGRVAAALDAQGLGPLVFDAYRPWSVTWILWETTPEALREFVADPRRGSRHNRGCALDLGLYDKRTGRAVDMGTDFDDFSPRARADCRELSPEQIQGRAILRRAMLAEGFEPLDAEWWHFDYHDWPRYPILNEPM